MIRWTVGLAAMLLCGGCFVSYGFAAGPTLDTDLDLGMQVSLRAEIGLPISDVSGVAEVIRIDAAPPGFASPQVSPVVGFDYFHILEDDEVALRAGIRARFQFEWADTFQTWIGGGASFAVLPELDVSDNEYDEHTFLGFELEGYYTDDSAAEVAEGEDAPSLGIFSLMLAYEHVIIDEDPWGEDW
jgi:hypothetical protein